MKAVKVIYFKASGKYYTQEIVNIPNDITGYEALVHELPKHRRIQDMYMLVTNSEPDGEVEDPYIVPHLYLPYDPMRR